MLCLSVTGSKFGLWQPDLTTVAVSLISSTSSTRMVWGRG